MFSVWCEIWLWKKSIIFGSCHMTISPITQLWKDGMKMLNTNYNVWYDVFKPTDRDDTFWHGYIYDVNSRKQKKWNTKEPRKREALKRVKERIEQIYGNGETVETSVRKFEPTTVGAICQQYLNKYYIPLKIKDKSKPKQKKLIASQKALINHITTHLGNRKRWWRNRTRLGLN
jgi:hypothetical protein